MWVGWVSSVHAQGPYEHLTPDNPDFERKVQVQCFLLLLFFFFLLFFFSSHVSGKKSFLKSSVGRQSFGFRGEGNEEMGPPFPLPSAPSSPRFLSPRGAERLPPSLLHHGADRRVRQVELARDVSGWVLLQRWRDTGGRRKGDTEQGVILDKRRIRRVLLAVNLSIII